MFVIYLYMKCIKYKDGLAHWSISAAVCTDTSVQTAQLLKYYFNNEYN